MDLRRAGARGTEARMPRRDPFEEVRVEILAEKVASLSHATHQLEEALYDLAHVPTERREHVLAEAAERFWCLIVQREAIGITHHEDLIEVLAVPREVIARMGLRAFVAGKPSRGRTVH
jgi:hypothetical protein